MFLLFLLIIDLYSLITAVITQMFTPTAEFASSAGIPTKESKAEIEIQPVIVKARAIDLLIYFFITFVETIFCFI